MTNLKQVVDKYIEKLGLGEDIKSSTIREIVRLVNLIEAETGVKYIRMEMGVPGLPSPQLMLDAEIEAIKSGVTSKYPMIEGEAQLKKEIARFTKLFLDLDVNEENCIPAVGSMQSAMALFLTVNRLHESKNKILFIDPGFPVQKQQCNVLGIDYTTFDIYNYRGDKLKDKIESYLKTSQYSALIYSTPNNPSWIIFTEKELQIIGELCNKYDVVAIEDLAYFGMDFRSDYSQPGKEPFHPTVANYTTNYVLMFSSSKIFSFAGERVASIVVSPEIFDNEYSGLKRNFKIPKFGYSLIYGSLYTLSAGVNHSAQLAYSRILKAVNDGEYNFVEGVKPYAEKAKVMKRLFLENGFEIVYKKDEDQPISDGFYFTLSYPGMDGNTIIKEMLYHGISAISLKITGSDRHEGLRACVSQVQPEQFETLEKRLKEFNIKHKIN